MKSFLVSSLLTLTLLSSSFAYAQQPPIPLPPPPPGTPTPAPGTPTPAPGTPTPAPGTPTPAGVAGGEIQRLQNPLGSNSIQEFFLKIMQILILFAVPLIVFFIILAGFKYVTARGNTEQITQATTALTWALVGGVLILGAEIILKVIQGTVTALQ